MPSVYDIVMYGLVAVVMAGTGYALLIALVIGDWPEGTPGPVKEGCLLTRGLEWCSQANALAWAISGCAESGDAEYEECVGFVFAERGGEREALHADLRPALWDRDAALWQLAGEAPRPGGGGGGRAIVP